MGIGNDVVSKVKVYEVDGRDTNADTAPLEVSSHWNRHALVCLKFESGKTITVAASHLEAAIRNATNTGV